MIIKKVFVRVLCG